ncbi:DUF2971 domain-containing protein [Mucilaginibacter auburnensis]|uniref:DUF2971 family protein n=1 Tax=Mucilaginibacter auburnensis TaxID=1457233 RepID=A0A2H9VV16_9SPHI|nr:DUF2971 domain-containing protein [Mucilaginibacter auburnensis]PJJ84673.1 Protein of unknown function (DUF2971) [Mucilaginibacter auburnensis]
MPPTIQRVRDEKRVIIDSRDYPAELIRKFIPKKLYKYHTVTKYFLEGLTNNELWFSSPLDFNDPFDCKVNLKFGNDQKAVRKNFAKVFPAERFSEIVDIDNFYQKLLDKPEMFQYLLNETTKLAFGDQLGVCCFSENRDHILMWSHYAGNHAGVCLQFNGARRGLIHDNILPVNYYDKYPVIKLSNYKSDELKTFYFQAICSKSDHWDYEFEWRAVVVGGRKTYPYKPTDLTGIIFGVNTTKEDFSKIDTIIQTNKLDHVQYYQAEMSEKAYRLNIKKIDR